MASEVTTLSYAGFALDSLGEITIVSQSSKMVPEKLGQKEVRHIEIKIEMFEQDYETNYNLILQAREALQKQNQVMVWNAPGALLSDGGEVPGELVLDRPVVITSHDLPADPNAWGTYNQLITVVAEFEVDLTDPTVHMQATFLATGGAGQPVNLGQIRSFIPTYRSTKYSEMRNIRERTAGSVNMAGEIFISITDISSEGGSADNRRPLLEAQMALITAQVNNRDGTLYYGLEDGATFFNQVVRVSEWKAQINQAVTGIEWSFTGDWTEFPNEAGYAAADFKVERGEDRTSGEKFIRLSGNIASPTPSAANAKLVLLMQTVLFNASQADQDNGWLNLAPSTFTTTPRYINSDDTNQPANPSAPPAVSKQQMGTEDAEGNYTSNNVFLMLEFSIQWRKKSSNLLSWVLKVETHDEAESGMQRVVYSGTVVASGATPDSAWNTAVAQARVLGDQKYPFRLNATEDRSDRGIDLEQSPPTNQVPIVGYSSAAGYSGTGIQEFVGCTFSYEYRVKGVRVYIEAQSELVGPTFGENGIRVSGFVVATNFAAAVAAYQSQVKANYVPNLILDESLTQKNVQIEVGQPWFGTADGYGSMFVRLDFRLNIWTAKPAGSFAVSYGIKVDIDYVRLLRTMTIEGTYWDTQANIIAAENLNTGNALDNLLNRIGAGNKTADSRSQAHNYLGVNNDNQLGLKFSQTWISKLTGSALILESQVTEEITYSGIRWRMFDTPDGPSVPQSLGVTTGSRAVGGSVTAATEAAAMAFIATQRALAYPSGVSAPAGGRLLQAPKISRSFEFIPLTASPVARGATPNFQVAKLSFTFPEILPNTRYQDLGGIV